MAVFVTLGIRSRTNIESSTDEQCEMKSENLDSGAVDVKTADPPAKDKGFWALNWLRFILAIYLVMFHTLLVNYPTIRDGWFAASLSLGNMATSIFFVLSGFLLMHAYVVMKNGRELNTRNFLVARFSTLYPLHVAGLLLAVIPVCVTMFARGGITVGMDSLAQMTRVLEPWEVALALLMCLTLLNAWNPFYMVFNGPSWSLSALGFYYVLFPLMALKIYRMKSPRTAIVLLALLFLLPGALADLLHRTDVFTEGLLHRNPVIRLPLFVAGMVLCVIFARSKHFGTPMQWFTSGSLIVATVALGMIAVHQELRLHIFRNGLFYPASLALIWICACAKPIGQGRLRYWGDRLGAASLPLFLLHIPLFAMFRKAEQFIAVWPSTSGGFTTVLAAARQAGQSLVFYPLFLVLLVAVCVLVQERFVTRMQKAIRNRFADRSDAASGARNAGRERATGTY
ncbi:acyltransferase family protein [Pseudoduganella umbonata]|uniref:Acyltransferase n=1 Tax=Pseudoduganella umbonata TaxID=864828 RepID=A0A4P8HV42_9BURK|nr:acyltransferase [Pseudoduganella umbonata]MBB3223183.1 peptidoglycan/LPS O-acetylase OafA/YrhL [Pseudoduganella umbonata]QCP13887.1 acyltransferase [Pseudoduganella umbonata]